MPLTLWQSLIHRSSAPPPPNDFLGHDEAARERDRKAYRYHVFQIPRLRMFGLSLVALFVLLHNLFLHPIPSAWSHFWRVLLLFSAYMGMSWLILLKWYNKITAVPLGFCFLVCDIVLFVVAIYYSGGERSWLFFLLMVRTADQTRTTYRKTLFFAHASTLGYGLLLAYLGYVEQRALSLPAALTTLGFLYASNLYLAFVAKAAENLRDLLTAAIHTARDLIRQRDAQATALQASESDYRALVERSIQGIYIHQQRRIQLANPALARIFGYDSPAALVGQEYTTLVAPHERDRLEGYRSAHLHGQPAPERYEYQGVRQDGTLVWIECLVSCIVWRGAPAILTTFQDITARRQAEEALRESEARYRLLADNITDIVWVRDINWRPLYITPSVTRVRGYSVEEAMAELPEESITPASLTAVKQVLEQWRQRERRAPGTAPSTITLEFESPCKDGSTVWLENHTSIVRDVTGGVTGFVGVNRDITARKQAEEALRESERRFRRLIEDFRQGIVIHRDLTPVFVNRAYAQMLGYDTPEAILALPSLSLLLAPQERERVHHYVQARHQGGDVPSQQEHQAIRRDGTLIWLDVRAQQVMWDGASAILVSIFDITARKQAEEALQHAHEELEARVRKRTAELQQANSALGLEIAERQRAEEERQRLTAQLQQAQKLEALGTLAGGIAHDFNNILAAILGYTELTVDKMPRDSRAWHHLQQVLSAGHRAKELVQQILTFSRHGSPERCPLQLDRSVREVLGLLRASLPATIEIHTHLAPEVGNVLANATQMHQVLLNLGTNAAQAMQESGGVLEIGLEAVEVEPGVATQQPALQPGPYVRLTVRDTGHGMAPDVLARIFEPFFTTKDVGAGTGLGLSVVHGIIAAHHGVIRVQSTVGQGTTCTIDLPRLPYRVVEMPQDEVPRHHGHGCILFVDDEAPLARLGQALLERLGYRVVVHTSSVQALEAFRAHPQHFDVVITDQNMPHLTGTQLAHALRRIRPDVPVILCTGFSQGIDAETVGALGIDAVCLKPFSARDLERVLHQVVAKLPV